MNTHTRHPFISIIYCTSFSYFFFTSKNTSQFNSFWSLYNIESAASTETRFINYKESRGIDSIVRKNARWRRRVAISLVKLIAFDVE